MSVFINDDGSTTTNAAVLSELAHMKALFQQRAITAALGFGPTCVQLTREQHQESASTFDPLGSRGAAPILFDNSHASEVSRG